MIGISLPLHLRVYRDIGPILIVVTLTIIFLVSFTMSYFIIKRFQQSKFIQSDIEAFVLFCQNNSRGLLGFTLAMQNFNARISGIALLYIVLSTLFVEPVMSFFTWMRLIKE
jgi:hypothetical protein